MRSGKRTFSQRECEWHSLKWTPYCIDSPQELSKPSLLPKRVPLLHRCDIRKALFCCTEDGRAAMSRQILPATHIDNCSKVLQYIAPHVSGLRCLNDLPAVGEICLRRVALCVVV